jgi:enoyl-CoA hydratase/carnithine racemase
VESLTTQLRELEHELNVRVVMFTGAGNQAFSVGATLPTWCGGKNVSAYINWNHPLNYIYVEDGHDLLGDGSAVLRDLALQGARVICGHDPEQWATLPMAPSYLD